MLNYYINKKYLNKSDKLKKEFINNTPFKYLVLKDFFDKKIINNFVKELRKEEFVKQESDLFSFRQTNDLMLSKNNVIKEFYSFLNSKESKEYLEKITGVRTYEKIDCSGFIYSNTDYLLPHDDKLEKRKIAYVLNLSTNFNNNDGGELELFNKNKVIKKIKPEFNTLTIFKVEINKTFHQVSEVLVDKERLSIAGWFNDK